MATYLHAVTAAHMLLAATVSLAASWAIRDRVVSKEARAAARALRVFWAGFGATAIVQAVMLALALTSAATPALSAFTAFLAYTTSVVALGALAAYFAFVFTGTRRAVPLAVMVYSAVLASGLFVLFSGRPVDLAPTRWTFHLVYADPPEGLLAAAPSLVALLPAILGTIGFLVVGGRSTGLARKRALLVGGALLFWLVSVLVDDAGPTETDPVQVTRKLASLVGFGAIYLAYLAPPQWQMRLGLVALGDEAAYPAQEEQRERTRLRSQEALSRRVRELV